MIFNGTDFPSRQLCLNVIKSEPGHCITFPINHTALACVSRMGHRISNKKNPCSSTRHWQQLKRGGIKVVTLEDLPKKSDLRKWPPDVPWTSRSRSGPHSTRRNALVSTRDPVVGPNGLKRTSENPEIPPERQPGYRFLEVGEWVREISRA